MDQIDIDPHTWKAKLVDELSREFKNGPVAPYLPLPPRLALLSP